MNRRRVFSLKELTALGYEKDAAYKVLQRLVDQGMVRKIRNGLYATVNVETGEVNASVLQIACGVHDEAFLSHQSALVAHGLMDWVFFASINSSVMQNCFPRCGVGNFWF
ncbi:MAG: hypothetical protein D5S00_05710 [Tindallia sp. MSAO_Bac2]|nr:MAG: hypothetical protein D5S00_05710 [Tindallia sp. MSAO_Bac2]